MSHSLRPATNPTGLLLGVEGGGTHTVAILATAELEQVRRVETGPGNVRLLTDAELVARLRALRVPRRGLVAVTIGLAGCRTPADRARILRAAERVWPGVPARATNDLETAFMAAPATSASRTRVLVLSGTGSCCYGRNARGPAVKVGGWGQLLGDHGSAYDLGLRAIRESLASFDATGNWPELGARLLRATQLNEPEDLLGWAHDASKDAMARLAIEVFAALAAGDRLARDVVRQAADALAQNATACAGRLAGPAERVEFLLAGGTLLKQSAYARRVMAVIATQRPGSSFLRLPCEGAWGAVRLARRLAEQRPIAAGQTTSLSLPQVPERTPCGPEVSLAESPTEQRNPRSMALDRMSDARAIELMLNEDAGIPKAILRERAALERALKLIARSLKRGGRLFYVGAGSSGRIGVLDASECPPTFRTPPEMVQGIIAGGQLALWQSVERAEDDPEAGSRAVAGRRVRKGDVVLGIAASGRTPFVWGALAEAHRRGARTILLCFNPAAKKVTQRRPDVILAPNVGPEILTGSTRLKAGTATKLVLNILTTLSMVRLGKVVSNLMVDLHPSNEKLRDRAVRIVCELTGCTAEAAQHALSEAGWVVKAALARLAAGSRRRRVRLAYGKRTSSR